MKKFSFLVAAAALSLTASAATRILYSQPFEAAANPEAAGWTCGGGDLTLPADENGKMLLFSLGQNNGRSAGVTWGTEIYSDENGTPIIEDDAYDMTFEFSMPTFPNNQQNSAITIFTNYAPLVNQPYRERWTPSNMTRVNNYLLDLTQIAAAADGQCQFCVNGDSTDVAILEVGTFYGVNLHVNIVDRTVEYVITNLLTDDELTSGTRAVPESYTLYGAEIKNEEGVVTGYEESVQEVSMYAEGMHLMAARYQTQYQIDNVKITCVTEHDYAAAPVVALSRIGRTADDEENRNIRAYNITFNEGETLHVVGTDGVETTADFEDAYGAYEYETTTSGTLKAWTVSGEATSEVIETEVDCTPYVLPQAKATIVSVSNGYSKTYSLSVDNSTVPLQPTIFMYWSYNANGNITTGDEPMTNGAKLTFDEAGVLTITTAAFGFAENEVQIYNDAEYTLTSKIDFVHKTGDEIKALGFAQEEDLNSASTSGETNWTGRRGMFYYDGNNGTEDPETGEIVYPAVYPFGFVAEDNTVNVIHRYKILSSALQADDYYKNIFPGIEIWNNYNAQMKEGIGLVLNTMKQGDAEDGNGLPKAGTVDIKVPNLNAGDFVVVKKIDNYGRNMEHPVCMSADEYDLYVLANVSEVYAATEEITTEGEETVGTGVYSVTFPLYRIDTALAGVEIYAGNPGGISDVINEPAQNNDPYYYSIDGIRTLEPAHTGIYIHQGKKVYIRK